MLSRNQMSDIQIFQVAAGKHTNQKRSNIALTEQVKTTL